MSQSDIHEWNRQTVNLVQASLGAISGNFRLISLDSRNHEWILHFILDHYDKKDADEIDDIVANFEALQTCALAIRIKTEYIKGDFDIPKFPARAIFLRK